MGWTIAQQKVINTRNKNLLVSAAAGSGKTAVLVERIISMISEGENPIDIDHLLVVTFTNAAAAEMRTRIGKAIDEKLLREPENLHLQKQISLLQSAQITTIHSFCLYVIRNYFHRIDLDPSFKIAEDSEITLMKSDVMEELLERWYEEGREDFHSFIESYSYSKSDAPVEELILGLYNIAMSDPWPSIWISKKMKAFDVNSLKEMYASDWMKELISYINVILTDLQHKTEDALAICNEPDGPGAYIPALVSDRDILEKLKMAGTYDEYTGLFTSMSYARLSPKKEEGVLAEKKDRVKELREEVKKALKDLTNQFFFQSPEEMLKDLMAVKDVMKVLFELTLDFMEEFTKKKDEKNLIDFNDLEHFALKILIEEKDNEKVPSQAARELSEQFDEILIDEYQDSNMVQETILKSISREQDGAYNRFMVGDVKQSIYKFRLAMPELFMEKYKDYSTADINEDGSQNLTQRIDLDKNFRSRKVVLDYVNRIFEQIMTEPVGGIIYDEAASLKYGELFEETIPDKLNEVNGLIVGIKDKQSDKLNETEMLTKTAEKSVNVVADLLATEKIKNRLAADVELLLVTEETEEAVDEVKNKAGDKASGRKMDLEAGNKEEQGISGSHEIEVSEDTSLVGDEEDPVYTKKELEARAIAKRIRELTNPNTGLLLFDNKVKSHRPASYRDIVILLRSMTGWSEVFVNTLMQEGIPAYADTGTGYFQTIEIMAVLNMLRIIDNPRQDIPFTGVLYSPMVGLTTTQLAKIRTFERNVSMYQAVASYAAEGDEIELKEKLNGFLSLLNAFREKVNHISIHELLQDVLDQTGYSYYVSAMPGGERRKANLDMLVAQAVRFEKGSYSGLFHFIRYIEKLHKYDLDFGEASTTDEQDNTVRIMSIHKSKGLEFPVVFVAGMGKQFNTQDVRSNVILHNQYGAGPECIDSIARTKVPTLLKKVIQKKVQIENLGEELRVLYVAMTRAKEKLILSSYLKSESDMRKKNFSFFEITTAKCYLDWVMPAMLNYMPASDESMVINLLHRDDLLREEITKQIFLHKDREDLLSLNPETVYDEKIREEIESRFHFTYPYQEESALKVKMTVSELKKLGQYIDEEQSVNLYEKYPEELTGSIKTENTGTESTGTGSIGTENTGTGNTGTESTGIESTGTGNTRTGNTGTENRKADHNILKNKNIDKKKVKETEEAAYIPAFIRQKEEVMTGTDRGTLYHKVLELMNICEVHTMEELQKDLQRMTKENRLREEDIKKLKLDYILKFIQSSTAERMRRAQADGRLYREKQFVIGIEANQLYRHSDSSELILIQGIIDVFFEEEGELVLLDYKSDIVMDEQELITRYQVQLGYYRKALEQMSKKRVKEIMIYSLHLGKEIRIDTNKLVTL